jgi:hypothetical protein
MKRKILLSDSQIPHVESKDVRDINRHWQFCKQNSLPYIRLRNPTGNYVTLDWDLFCIDIAHLGLTETANHELSEYLESLLKDEHAREAMWGSHVTGWVRLRKYALATAPRRIWEIVSNPLNWGFYDAPTPESTSWLKHKQETRLIHPVGRAAGD